MQSSALICEGLLKTYRATAKRPAKDALKGIDLAIPQGSFFGLLGPNGAGKSTLINILAGLVNKTGGKVHVQHWDIDTHMRQAKFNIGIVPQELILDPFFTVYEALENHAGYYGIAPKDRKTNEIIKALKLEDKAHNKPRSLSGGMRRRLLVAKALVHSPSILVLDEPTAGVDVELRQQLWEYVKELNRQGTTVLLTTHYLEEAEALCDQIAIINHGRIIASESKSTLMKRLNRKTVRIQLQDALTAIPASLAVYEAILIDAHTLEISYKTSEVVFEAILFAIKAAGLTILDLSTKEPNLEAVFRYLTHEGSHGSI
ncbi:MAG: ABC transporter ATP-binding protein [Alphaproteobacteria bacterium]|nr:ABC transporter ATP-binding protein [Alphaproteobacteria bacterium]